MTTKSKTETTSKYIGMLVPTLLAIIALAVQWGAVKTTLENFEKRLDKESSAVEKIAETLIMVQKDLSFIKGKIQDR